MEYFKTFVKNLATTNNVIMYWVSPSALNVMERSNHRDRKCVLSMFSFLIDIRKMGNQEKKSPLQ